ncbi:MAG: hypothetical protein ABIJ09_21785 [Pseudomonadota bacterium]
MMTVTAVSLLLASHLFGPGGLVGTPVAEPTVGVDGDEVRAPVSGLFPWEYGAGLEPLLDDKERAALKELRDKKTMLSSIAVACGAVGSMVTVISLFVTPNFVNVLHPDPGGLAIPIVLGVGGLVIAGVSIPLVALSPAEDEIETLVYEHNSTLGEGARKLRLADEVLPAPLRQISRP